MKTKNKNAKQIIFVFAGLLILSIAIYFASERFSQERPGLIPNFLEEMYPPPAFLADSIMDFFAEKIAKGSLNKDFDPLQFWQISVTIENFQNSENNSLRKKDWMRVLAIQSKKIHSASLLKSYDSLLLPFGNSLGKPRKLIQKRIKKIEKFKLNK